MNIVTYIAVVVALVSMWFAYQTTRTPDALEQTDGVAEESESLGILDAVDEAKEVKRVIEGTQEEAPQTSGATLDLSGQGLTSVPKSVFDRKDITVLNLSHNALSGSLPAEIRHVSNLRTLDLSSNNFTGVPAEIGQLSQLEVLNLSGNPITGLPNELGNLKNLKVLDLRNTNYSTQDLEVIKKGLPAGVTIRV